MAFRYTGTAWDGQRWAAAPSIMVLGKQVEAIRPGTFAADGTVAGNTHDAANPNSDHTVWPKTGSGVVYAIDITETSNFSIDNNFEAIRLAQHPALKYAIHDRRMFSSYPSGGYAAWVWRPYSGPSPHAGHGHISVHHDSRGSLTTPWPLVGQTQPPPPGDDDMRMPPEREADLHYLVARGAISGPVNDYYYPNPPNSGAQSNDLPDWEWMNLAIAAAAGVGKTEQGGGGAHNHDGVYVKNVTVSK